MLTQLFRDLPQSLKATVGILP